MLNKLLIAAIILTIALVGYGTTTAIATGQNGDPQVQRPGPSMPADPKL